MSCEWDDEVDCVSSPVSQMNIDDNSADEVSEKPNRILGSGLLGRKNGIGRGRGLFMNLDQSSGSSGNYSTDRPSRGRSICYKCNEEGHMARDCTNARQTNGGEDTFGNNRPPRRDPGKCYKCNEEGHMARDCPNAGQAGDGGNTFGNSRPRRDSNKCYKCNEGGHMARDCTNEGQSGDGGNSWGGDRPPRRDSNKCYKCNEVGHMARDCTNAGQSDGGSTWGDDRPPRRDSNKCYKCQQEGHRARECPDSAQTDNEWSGFGNTSSSGRGRDATDSNQRKCYKCNGEGHFAKECPNAQDDGNKMEGKRNGCFKCGQEGHMAKDCENPPIERVGENGEVKPPPVTYVPVELSPDELFDQGVSAGINFAAYQSADVKVSGNEDTCKIPKNIESFSEANLRKLLLENIEKARYTIPTPIQKYTIPIVMGGRDLMACAQTGSGKTAAFLLPILHYVLSNNIDCSLEDNQIRPTALILSPTRELTIQIFNEARKFANESIVRVCLCYGGTSVAHQIQTLQRRGCHVLVATPGRLFDFVNKGSITFSSLKYLVLDEADRMIDMGFKPDVDKVVEHVSTPPKGERQTLMFSATFAENIQQLAKKYLHDYVFVSVGIVGSANVDVKQTILQIEKVNKREALTEFLQDQLEINKDEKILVFVETKRMADFIASYLCKKFVGTTSIHGDRLQHQREEALREFKTGVRNVLVATAVAARGLDIKGVGIVVNYDLPKDIDEYVHRIGRTGRVGNPGRAVSYFDIGTDVHLAGDLVKLLSDAEQEVPDWLIECNTSAFSGGSSTSYTGRRNFGAADIRRKGVTMETYPAVAAFGGPISVTGNFANEEEESWE